MKNLEVSGVKVSKKLTIPADLYSKLLDFYISSEEASDRENVRKENISFTPVGLVNVKTPTENIKINIAILYNKKQLEYAALVKTTDNEIFILIDLDFLSDMLYNESTGEDYLKAVIAHEVGHFLSGHLTSKKGPDFLTGKIKKQKELLDLAERATTAEEYEPLYVEYMSLTLQLLLKGSVFKKELEADIHALNFVKATSLIALHSVTLDSTNFFTKLEKMNRINKINSLDKKYKIDYDQFDLEIIFKNSEILKHKKW